MAMAVFFSHASRIFERWTNIATESRSSGGTTNRRPWPQRIFWPFLPSHWTRSTRTSHRRRLHLVTGGLEAEWREPRYESSVDPQTSTSVDVVEANVDDVAADPFIGIGTKMTLCSGSATTRAIATMDVELEPEKPEEGGDESGEEEEIKYRESSVDPEPFIEVLNQLIRAAQLGLIDCEYHRRLYELDELHAQVRRDRELMSRRIMSLYSHVCQLQHRLSRRSVSLSEIAVAISM